MYKIRTSTIALLTLPLIAGVATVHAIDRYTVTTLPSAAGFGNAWTIDAAGAIGGTSVDEHANFRGMRWSTSPTSAVTFASPPGFAQAVVFASDALGRWIGAAYNLGDPEGASAFYVLGTSTVEFDAFLPRGANAAGTIVGSKPVTNSSGLVFEQPCINENESTRLLPTLGGSSGMAYDVDDAGRVVGSAMDAQQRLRPCVWINNLPRDLGTLGGLRGQAVAINAHGAIVGASQLASGLWHATIWQIDAAGNITSRADLGALRTTTSFAWDINDLGDVVGTSDFRATLWRSGQMLDLNSAIEPSSPWRLDVASVISNQGRIAGWGLRTGQPLAFVLDRHCTADLDDGTGTGTPDGGVTIDDLLFYLVVFEQGVTRADLDDGTGTGTPDGGVTIDDLLYFLVRFEAGC